jgi:ribosome-associated protein
VRKFKIRDEYIQLNQLIKALSWCENGAQANSLIDEGLVKVNGVVEHRKRNKIMPGFTVEFDGNSVIIE